MHRRASEKWSTQTPPTLEKVGIARVIEGRLGDGVKCCCLDTNVSNLIIVGQCVFLLTEKAASVDSSLHA